MVFSVSSCIEEREGALKITGTRVSLASVIIGFQEGESPEQIAPSFPTLTLAQVYGAIAYYLENEPAINGSIADLQREFEQSVPPLSQTNPELFARLMAARRQIRSNRS